MSTDHFRHRGGKNNDGAWLLWSEAWGDVSGFSTAGIVTTPADFRPAIRQPIGFRGANPGESRDDAGRLRVRVKAGGRPA